MERLTREFNMLLQNPDPYITVNLIDNSVFHWKGTLSGLDGTPYEGGMFRFEIIFPSNFPTNAPEFIFKTPIFHPNVNPGSGRACCSAFGSDWNSRCTVRNIIAYVVALLNEPNPSGGYGGEATTACRNSIEEFNRMAREETLKNAMG